jgi:hypothetical protein
MIVLAAVRNVIVHKAGCADLDYLNKLTWARKSSLPSLTSVKVGDSLPVHGDSIKQMQVSAVKFCETLISFVDAQLAKTSK